MIKNRLKDFRIERGLSQEELAEKSGISRTTLSKIENNEEAAVNTRTIAKLAEVFNVKPSDIFLMYPPTKVDDERHEKPPERGTCTTVDGKSP